MMVWGLFILGCIGWITVVAGWWIPEPKIALLIGAGLVIFMLIELTFLRKRKAITLSAALTYFNIAFGCWVHAFWLSNGYPYPLWITRFLLIVTLTLSAIMPVGFMKGGTSGDRNRSRQSNNNAFKSLFERKRKKDKDTKDKEGVSIVLGESVENNEHQNEAGSQ